MVDERQSCSRRGKPASLFVGLSVLVPMQNSVPTIALELVVGLRKQLNDGSMVTRLNSQVALVALYRSVLSLRSTMGG